MNMTSQVTAGYNIGASSENIFSTDAVFSNNVVPPNTNAFNGSAPETGNFIRNGPATTNLQFNVPASKTIFYSTDNYQTLILHIGAQIRLTCIWRWNNYL